MTQNSSPASRPNHRGNNRPVTLIRVWIEKHEAGAYDDDAEAVDLIHERDARIAALERLVGRQALEIEFLKGAARNSAAPRSAPGSAIIGPKASPSNGGAS